ncbi:MAG: succinate dehydrogenase [Armatimonadota bacterium]|nr:succinate dehydrogenase [bacterium]MCS7310744.1 succinate dehydrogenase [Armatimonadota bacterium]MDW8290204.1 succinate dehydrogenase [Armatimonadota bacterium]
MAVVTTTHRRSIIAADNHVLHKLHSLSGIVPIGIFLVQHLTLNSFALAGPEKFNAVIDFFNKTMPRHILHVLEWGFIFIPLLFHALYGLVITAHGQANVGRYGYWRNWMYLLQRVTGVILIVFIAAHVWGTTISHRLFGTNIYYDGMKEYFSNGWLVAFYLLGITSATFHLANGIWNFAIRWGITVSERSQQVSAKVCAVIFVLLTALGWTALFAFR